MQGIADGMRAKKEEARMFAEGYEAKRRLQARGRMKPGTMNKTEKAYSLYLKAKQSAGRVEQFWFESVKLKSQTAPASIRRISWC